LYAIGTQGFAGREFSSTFFTYPTPQDIEFAKNLKVGNHGFIIRTNNNCTYAKLVKIKVDRKGVRMFRFQCNINGDVKEIPENKLVHHIRRANQFVPNSFGSFVLTQNSTNDGHSNDIFKLVVGPKRSEEYTIKSGKSKGNTKCRRFCQVLGCRKLKQNIIQNEVDLCIQHGNMYKRSGSRISENDITKYDVIGTRNVHGNNVYQDLCAEYKDRWFDDDSTNDYNTEVKLHLVEKICEEFSRQVPDGRFLIVVGKDLPEEAICEMTNDEIYAKIYRHMNNLKKQLKSEYIL
jgi:hypothetical protein